MFTAQEGHLHVAKFLVEHGAEVQWYATFPRLFCIEHLPFTFVKNKPLSKKPSNKRQRNIYPSLSPFHCVMQVNIQSKDGSTALIAAAIKGQVDVATFLIAHGADIDAVHSDGWTALIACADEGCFELAKILLAAGAELDVVDKEDWTALRSASQKGHYNIVKHLLDAGVDVTTPDKQGWTALHVAAGYGRVALIPLLLESGAIENIDAETKQGFSSVMVASEYGFLEVVQLLVAYGCDTTVVKEAGTLISRARMYGKAEVADWLERAAGWGPLRVVADVPLPPRIGKYLLRQGTCFLSLFSLRALFLSLSR